MASKSERNNRITSCCFVAILIASVTFTQILSLATGQPQAEPKMWEKPVGEGCIPQVINLTDISRISNYSTAYDEFLVPTNSTVQLQGIAERVRIGISCDVQSDTLPFQWSLILQNRSGEFTDYAESLNGSNTLLPSFLSDKDGKYEVKLTGGRIIEIILRLIRLFTEGWWLSAGPDNIAGHMSAISLDPATKHIYAGANTGGVWKSTDDGASWVPLTDHKLPSQYIGALAADRRFPGPDNPQSEEERVFNIYAGLIRTRYNTPEGYLIKIEPYTGGIFVTRDGGLTWERSGEPGRSCQGTLSDNLLLSDSSVFDIELNPLNHSIVYAGTHNGVFRTTNGGECWFRISDGFASQEISDISIAWTKPFPTIFAGVWNHGIYRTTEENPSLWTFIDPVGVGKTSSGDKRLYISTADRNSGFLPFPRFIPGSIVGRGDPDAIAERPLSNFLWSERHTERNLDESYQDEDIYRHFGNMGDNPPAGRCLRNFEGQWAVENDARISDPDAGTVVTRSDPDFHSCLRFFNTDEKHVDQNINNVFEHTESVYRDKLFNKVVIAASHSHPHIIYAGFNSEPYRIFKSTNEGITWQELRRAPQNCTVFHNQCDYNNFLAVDPRNPDIVYLGQVPLFVSVNGGNSWIHIGGPNTNRNDENFGLDIHTDQHALEFDPTDPSKFYVGNDGGIFKFTINRNDPDPESFFSTLDNGLVTTQFYDMGISPQERYIASGGTQDNANMIRYANTWLNFWQIFGWAGDGFENDFDSSSTDLLRFLYFNGYWGDSLTTRRESLATFGPDTELSSTNLESVGTFFADPFATGILLRISVKDHPTSGSPANQLYRATNANTAPNLVWNCIDPTPTNAADSVTTVTFRKDNQPNGPSDILVGMSDGSIYRIDGQILNSLPTFQDCATPPPQYDTAITKIYPRVAGLGCIPPIGQVNSIAVDYSSSQTPELYTIYASFSGSGVGRVLHLFPVSESPLAFCGQDISGDPSNTLSLPSEKAAKDIVVHPNNPNLLLLATHKGLFEGRFSPENGIWKWSIVRGVPDVDITALKKQETKRNVNGAVQTSTYGRGVFDLYRPPGTSEYITPQPPTNVSLVNSSRDQDRISSCEVREFDGPKIKNRAIHIKVGYSYNSDNGEEVWIRPTILENGNISRHFINQAEKIHRGTGNTDLIVIYAGSGAPLALNTTSIRLDMFNAETGIFHSSVCDVPVEWINSQANELSVDSILIPEEGPSRAFPLPTKIVSNLGNDTRLTPFDIISNNTTNTSLEVPKEFKWYNEELNFSHWILNRSSLSDKTRIAVPINSDFSATAVYRAKPETEGYSLNVQSLCTNCNYPLGDLMSPLTIMYDVRERTLYSPAEYKEKAGIQFDLLAPAELVRQNKNLTFLHWYTPEGLSRENPISVSLSNSSYVTAVYGLKDAAKLP